MDCEYTSVELLSLTDVAARCHQPFSRSINQSTEPVAPPRVALVPVLYLSFSSENRSAASGNVVRASCVISTSRLIQHKNGSSDVDATGLQW